MNSTGVITLNKVNKCFKDQVVLKDISAVFCPGSIYGIIGRNGSGKTVLMKAICGLMPINSGEILINGKEIAHEARITGEIGAIIEAPGFLPNHSGFKNLRYLADIQGKIDTQTIQCTMVRVGLNPALKKRVGAYSLGMRQRLGIAQAIMEDPAILVLDEPMNGLDNQGVLDMRDLFISLKEKGKTILLASHNREDIEVLCDHVYQIDAGKMISTR